MANKNLEEEIKKIREDISELTKTLMDVCKDIKEIRQDANVLSDSILKIYDDIADIYVSLGKNLKLYSDLADVVICQGEILDSMPGIKQKKSKDKKTSKDENLAYFG